MINIHQTVCRRCTTSSAIAACTPSHHRRERTGSRSAAALGSPQTRRRPGRGTGLLDELDAEMDAELDAVLDADAGLDRDDEE